MTVLVLPAGSGPDPAIAQVLETFAPALDFSRGFLIKPNIVFPVSPRTGQITSPGLVRALVRALRAARPDADVIIAEGTAAGTVPEENFRVSGFAELAAELGVPLVDLDRSARTPVPWKYGTLLVPEDVLSRNYINVPVLKMSTAAVLSGALKNQKGILLPEEKKQFHRRGLHEPIAELARTVRPQLTVLDCSNFFADKLLLAGDNLYEVDACAAQLLDIEQPRYLDLARQLGVGTDGFEVLGSTVSVRRTAPFSHHQYKRRFNIGLWSNPRACSMCRLQLAGAQPFRPFGLRRSFRLLLKLARASLTGTDFIFGAKAEFDSKKRRIVCVGDCTRPVAREGDRVHVPGCPPSYDEILNAL
jgi:uncharacterized protein (DUF362 family)